MATFTTETDIQNFLEDLSQALTPATRIIIAFYSNLWRPLLRVATALGLAERNPRENWIAPEDLQNLLLLAGYELVREESKLLIPSLYPRPQLSGQSFPRRRYLGFRPL